ncbi:uncharacterized protein N7503_010060 [Penicillium pulvis]|uniref:uncharacterized protein n=1 Tax=Penicillium pulvis TaxID=1562058 RepID=UPI002548D05B|nr:uncharacterized protein N7503_010060 [Penicillium pulvis]KAJ5784848.1 hypothetical protein N7503_010060 [Penicillium pulvis]
MSTSPCDMLILLGQLNERNVGPIDTSFLLVGSISRRGSFCRQGVVSRLAQDGSKKTSRTKSSSCWVNALPQPYNNLIYAPDDCAGSAEYPEDSPDEPECSGEYKGEEEPNGAKERGLPRVNIGYRKEQDASTVHGVAIGN